MTDDNLRFPPSLRWPAPRDIPVTEEHHCAPGCPHLAEARRRGHEEGARAERERQDRREGSVALAVIVAFLAGLFVASMIRLSLAWLAGR